MARRHWRTKREQNKLDMEALLLRIIAGAGAAGVTITAIESEVPYDRHTIVKYLLVLEQRGIISCRIIGKAKIWSLNTAPFQTIFSSLKEPKSYIEQVLAAVVHSVPVGLVVVDSQYTILFANAIAQKINPQATTIYELFSLQNPVKLTELVSALGNSDESADPYSSSHSPKQFGVSAPGMALGKQTFHAPNGKWYTLSIQSFARGDQRAAVVLIEDITEQRNDQQLIIEQAAQLSAERNALDASAIVAETDLRGVITFVNDKFCKISGYSRSELLGSTHAIINSGYHPKEFWATVWRTIASGKVWQGEILNKRKDGSFYWVDSVIAPVIGPKKKPVKYLAIRFDITKYKDPSLLKNRRESSSTDFKKRRK